MPPPAILSLSGLQRFGKQAASLFLLCSGPVFISFIQRVPGKVLKLATGIICFSSCLPQADAARLPVLPCSPAAPALQRIPCTRVCVCVCREGKQPQAFCRHLQLPSSAFVDVCPRPLSSVLVAVSPGLQPLHQDVEKGELCWWLWDSMGLWPWERCKWS